MSATIYTLHSATAYNASAGALNGASIECTSGSHVLAWFTLGAAYDGVVRMEISPDGGTTWFELTGKTTADADISAAFTPTAAQLVIYTVPRACLFRARMSGGTVGTLSVFARQVFMSVREAI